MGTTLKYGEDQIMKIFQLADYPAYINTVSQMIYDEFVVPTTSSKTFEDVQAFFEMIHNNKLPLTLIAIINNQCVGTVSLFKQDCVLRPQYTPWLASLYVDPKFRHQNIGGALIKALIERASELGYKKLYLKTENTAPYYYKIGWTHLETITHKDQTIDYFYYDLNLKGNNIEK